MQVDMRDAKTRLSELVTAAEAGEDVVIARGGTPAVRLVAIAVGIARLVWVPWPDRSRSVTTSRSPCPGSSDSA